VHQLGRDLYIRLSTMGDHLAKVGTSLSGAVTSYNRAIGSLEARVLVSARRLAELGVSADDLTEPGQVEVTPRQLQAPELVDNEYEALLAELRGEPPRPAE
jgi:DNA recombination protein RmuC